MVSIVVDVSTIAIYDGGESIRSGVLVNVEIEVGSCGFTLSLAMSTTTFCNSSTLTNIGLFHNLAYYVDWSRIFWRSSSVDGLMF